MDEEGNFRNEEGNARNQLFIRNGPWHLKRHNKWMGDTWHVSWSGKSTWFPTNNTMTRGTISLANVQKKSHFSGRPMDKGATDDIGKSSTPDSSIRGRPGQWQQPMKVRTRKILSMSKTGRTRLEIISSWANTAQPTLLFWHGHYTPILEWMKLMWTVANDG